MKRLGKEKWNDYAPVVLCILIIFILLIIQTGYEGAVIYKGTVPCRAEVLSADNSEIIDTGLIKSGEQTCIVVFREGKFKGKQSSAYNLLNGSLESDKIFKRG